MTFPLHRRVSSSGAPSAPDILKDLFGPRPFADVLALLDPHVESLLWKAIDPIDVGTFLKIKTAKRPSRELVLHLRAHKDDVELNEAFRRAVEENETLGKLVRGAAEGKERPPARRQSSLPAAPTADVLLQSRELLKASTDRCKARTLPFPEIKHPDQWESEVLAVLKDNAPPLVVTFYDTLVLLPEDYVAEMSQLAKECRGEPDAKPRAKFMKATIAAVRERADSIIENPIDTFPTVLIIFSHGFRRVDGLNAKRVRKRLLGRRRPSDASSPASTESPTQSPPTLNSMIEVGAEPAAAPAVDDASTLVKPLVSPEESKPADGSPPASSPVVENRVDAGQELQDGSPKESQTRKPALAHLVIPLRQENVFLEPSVVLQWLPSLN